MTMLVKMLTNAAAPTWPTTGQPVATLAGERVDVPDALGAELIAAGCAVAVEDPVAERARLHQRALNVYTRPDGRQWSDLIDEPLRP